MNVLVLEEATDDLAQGFLFYENQEAGLGDYFLDSLWSDIHSLRFYGGIHSKHFGFHRLLSRRFPYAIYYRVDADGIVRVQAVLDCRQNPVKFKKRLL